MLQIDPQPDNDSPAGRHILQFLRWIALRPRTYNEAMEAWRTSCPRLSAWEDAVLAGLVRIDASESAAQGSRIVCLTETGEMALKAAVRG